MKSPKLLVASLVVAAIVLILPELLGTGPAVGGLGIGEKLEGGALLIPLALIFVGGLLTALTPCVYPLIPITVSIFGARKSSTRGQAVALSLTFVLGIAVMFTSLGIGAALTGKAFGSALGNPWVVCTLAIVFAAFAFSMFGGWDFQLPASLQAKLGSVGKAGYGGAFAMGLVSGIVAAPCTGPVLSGVLVHIATTQNVVLGGLMLFVYALGLGVPFFLIGAFSLSLPKSGVWMDYVKSIFGVALLTVALMYLRDAFPAFKALLSFENVAYGAIVASALVLVGMMLGAINRSFHIWPADGVLKALGVALVVLGITLRPHAPIAQPVAHATWHSDEASALAQAQGKPAIIDFSAEWCAACKELEHKTFPTAPFLDEVRKHGWSLARIDCTQETPENTALQAKYKVVGLPTVIFIDASGKVREDLTLTGFLPPEEFAELMRKVTGP